MQMFQPSGVVFAACGGHRGGDDPPPSAMGRWWCHLPPRGRWSLAAMALAGGMMRAVLRTIASDPTSLHGGRRGRIRSGSTHRLEGPWQRVLVRHPDPGRGCSLPTAWCRTSSILRLVARSTVYRRSSRSYHEGLIRVLVPCAAAGQMPCAWFDVAGQGLADVARQGVAVEHKQLCHVVRRWRGRR